MEAAWKTEISGLAGESTTKYGIKDLKETLLQLVSLVKNQNIYGLVKIIADKSIITR